MEKDYQQMTLQHLNTSHVKVNHKGETGLQGAKGFKYISC